MQIDFHYYATYCAAFLAGYTHEESLALSFAAQFTDCCTRHFLRGIKAPVSAATTQSQTELMDARTDLLGLQDITRIWASFHFLPSDLYAEPPVKCLRIYKHKYRLICGPNGPLVADTVRLAKDRGIEAAGIAMHVLADTWAHRYFAGTPSLVINNTNYYFHEITKEEGQEIVHPVRFRHNPSEEDDLNKRVFISSLYQISENAVMNLGHGRAGHLPDYSFICYKYLPAWGNYKEIIKDNPSDYYHAFCQMIHAMKYLKGDIPEFETGCYDTAAAEDHRERIEQILKTRQTDSSADWKKFGEELSGHEIPPFDKNLYTDSYLAAEGAEKDNTFLGRFILAALAQKSMVTNKIARSGNPLAGLSIDYNGKMAGIQDFIKLIENRERRAK